MSASAKAFYADLACVKKSEFNHVSAIRRGDSDGEITFKYSDANDEDSLEIQVVATDLNSYPHGTSFMVFTSSETCSNNIVRRLEQLSATSRGYSLHRMIEVISNGLASVLDETHHDAESNDIGEGDEGHSEGDDTDMEFEEFEPIDVVDDEYFEVQAISRPISRPMFDTETTVSQNVDGLQRIQRELKASKLAGFSVGIYSLYSLLEECPAGIVSLSIRVSKLNLPSAAISAWGLESTDYLVLLVKFLGPYPDSAAILSATSPSQPVEFRFGKCKFPKPSVQCARMAFRPILNRNDESDPGHEPENDSMQPSETQDKLSFNSIYMSSTIDYLLNRRFFKLLKLRLDHHCSWDMAQILLNQSEGQVGTNDRASENANCGEGSSKSSLSSNGPSSLYYDDSLEDECRENLSFILVAMRFSLRRLCKCTEYCMVCHQRRGNDIQTIKPYVCSKSLCLYQYLSLAFGTSLEAEIINSPYVVDLLISLFYSSLATGCLREFPCGLALKVPLIEQSQDNVKIEFCPTSSTVRVTGSETKFDDGDWVLVVTRGLKGFEKRIWRLSHTSEVNLYSFQEIYHMTNPREIAYPLQLKLFPGNDKCVKGDWLPAVALTFSHDPDDLTRTAKRLGLQQLLDAMPSVLEMRKFLLDGPERKLGAWNKMNRSALSLTSWIVASNTSYIVQDSIVPVVSSNEENEDMQPVTQKDSTIPGMIQGLESSWMQFRFAQGSPDKESAFAKAVQTLCSTHPSKTAYPTLFAWHGSTLGNWHSIIRTGLDFSQISNGRAFGQGVYLSRDMKTSRIYMGKGHMIATPTVDCHDSPWPKSDLRPKSALSICEIINCPHEFVSRHPHFVIDKTEWIQCRYLLLQVEPTENAMQNPMFSASPYLQNGYIEQEPGNEIVGGQGNLLQIPITATSFAGSYQRGYLAEAEAACKDVEAISTEAGQDGGGGYEDGDDPEVLTEKIQALMTATSRERSRRHDRTPSETFGEAPVQTELPTSVNLEQSFQTAPTAPNAPMSRLSPLTFRPGTLDLSTLPQLPQPAWAASSRMALQALTREIRDLYKTQSQNDAASLGWYFDTAKVSNLFQWIVELHTFDADLPLAKDMMRKGHASVVLEIRFGSNFPMSPPFVRVVRPRFLPFQQGGGGHVTAGGAICSEMLTGSGWSPAMSMENVFLQIRLALCDTERPARLDTGPLVGRDYGIREAVDAYVRAAQTHGWVVPQDLKTIEKGWM
ncbi:hypothetical protein E4U55_000900 [Claviceps digitariae]|nr:hypothetical protein E4U55_000900 [Claviceps digitariae]